MWGDLLGISSLTLKFQFAKSLMTSNLSPGGTDAWIDRLYATGPTSPVVRRYPQENSGNLANDFKGWYFIVAARKCPISKAAGKSRLKS